MPTYTLTTGVDTIAGTQRRRHGEWDAATLTAGDSLAGDAGHDVLQLFGAGTFDLSGLAQFTGFEEVNRHQHQRGALEPHTAQRRRPGRHRRTITGGGGTVQLADGAVTLDLRSYTVNVRAGYNDLCLVRRLQFVEGR